MPRPNRGRTNPAATPRQDWERLHGMAAPAAASRDFLQRDVVYRLQAGRHGGLSATTRRHLATLASGEPAPTSRTSTPRIKPGSTLLREWHGRTYTVLALEDGFEMAGQHFASLSEIARHVTGAHWSGPRFFGLQRARKARITKQPGDAHDA